MVSTPIEYIAEKNWVEKFIDYINANEGMTYSTDKDYLISFSATEDTAVCKIFNNKNMKEYELVIRTDFVCVFYVIVNNDEFPYLPLVECKIGTPEEEEDWEFLNGGVYQNNAYCNIYYEEDIGLYLIVDLQPEYRIRIINEILSSFIDIKITKTSKRRDIDKYKIYVYGLIN